MDDNGQDAQSQIELGHAVVGLSDSCPMPEPPQTPEAAGLLQADRLFLSPTASLTCTSTAPAGAVAAFPLSNGHIGPQICYATGGTYAKLHGPKHRPRSHTDMQGVTKDRGPICGMSGRSQRRCMDRLASLDRPRVAPHRYFGTLTYPAAQCPPMKEVRQQRRAFIKRLRRRFDIQFVFWKLEPQKNGTPHFHLLIASHETIPPRLFAYHWWDVCGRISIDHLQVHQGIKGGGNRPALEEIQSWNGVLAYAAKYVAKKHLGPIPEDWEGFRWWGCEGDMPITIRTFDLTPGQALTVKRTMTKYLQKKLRRRRRIKTYPTHGIKCYMTNDLILRIIQYAWDKSADQARQAEGLPTLYTPPPGRMRCPGASGTGPAGRASAAAELRAIDPQHRPCGASPGRSPGRVRAAPLNGHPHQLTTNHGPTQSTKATRAASRPRDGSRSEAAQGGELVLSRVAECV